MIASFGVAQQLLSAIAGVVLVAGPPAWVWATLLMAGFAALTVFTMVLARIPTLRSPPPLDADEENGDTKPIEDNDRPPDVDDA